MTPDPMGLASQDHVDPRFALLCHQHHLDDAAVVRIETFPFQVLISSVARGIWSGCRVGGATKRDLLLS